MSAGLAQDAVADALDTAATGNGSFTRATSSADAVLNVDGSSVEARSLTRSCAVRRIVVLSGVGFAGRTKPAAARDAGDTCTIFPFSVYEPLLVKLQSYLRTSPQAVFASVDEDPSRVTDSPTKNSYGPPARAIGSTLINVTGTCAVTTSCLPFASVTRNATVLSPIVV